MTNHRQLTGSVVIATHNPGKLSEMRELLLPYGIGAQSAAELKLAEPDETGKTFAANARIKAVAARHDILRVKGFVAVPDKAMRMIVQGVGDRVQRYFDRPWEAGEKRVSRLVVIGQAGFDAAAVAAELRA